MTGTLVSSSRLPVQKTCHCASISTMSCWHSFRSPRTKVTTSCLIFPQVGPVVTQEGAGNQRNVVMRERYKLCPWCSNFSEFSAQHVYCIVCGEKLIEECEQCHEPIIYPTARYCPACGAQLVKSRSVQRPS